MLLFLTATPIVYALDWAASFVVWKGNVYTVQENVTISSNKIGKQIGIVKRMANDHTGRYYGDAANILEKGTAYYEIKDVPAKHAIAVKVGERYLLAEYARPAQFHIMNVLLNQYFWLLVVVVFIFLYRLHKRSITRREK